MRMALALLIGLVMPGLDGRPQTAARAQDLPRKIVSIGGDVTETLYLLGRAQEIVAVDATSLFPPEALKQKPSVGYMRALSPEGVLSVGGTVIIASDKAGPADVVKALKASAKYVEIGEGAHPEAVPEKVRAIAKAVDETAVGEKLASEIERDLAKLAEERKTIGTPVRTLFVLNMQGGRLMVAGKDTNADAMLRLAGLANVADEIKGYKPIGEEALVAMSPEFVLVMRATGNHNAADIENVASLASTPAGRNKRIVTVDGGYLLSFGPRVATAARELMQSAYPNLARKSEAGR